MRARSEILAMWAALKQLSENINDAMCIVSLRLTQTKNFNMVLSFFVNIGSLGCFEFAQLKASVELCFNKLSDAAAKFEVKKLIGKSLIVN